MWLSNYAIFSENLRDGEQNLLWVLNLIYGAHNGRGVGLPDVHLFFSKFHYVEFSLTSYTGVGCPLKECFLKTSPMESKTFCAFLISYMEPTMVGVGFTRLSPFLGKIQLR